MATSHERTQSVNGTPTNGAADLLSRGLALAKALAAAPDAPLNAPLVDVDLVDEAPEEPEGYHFPATGACFRAWLDGRDPEVYHPTPEDEAEAAEIFGAMDSRQHLDRSDRLTLAQLIERQVSFYAGWQTAAGTLLADTLADLAAAVRYTEAASVEEYRDRLEILEQDARADRDARMWDAGFDAGCRQAMPYHGPLD
jgi:hypothetical protein